MTPLPPPLVARLAQTHRDACELMLELHRIRVDAHAAGADELTLARLTTLQLTADAAWRDVRREHARHDPAEAAAQQEAERHLGARAHELAALLRPQEPPHAR